MSYLNHRITESQLPDNNTLKPEFLGVKHVKNTKQFSFLFNLISILIIYLHFCFVCAQNILTLSPLKQSGVVHIELKIHA